MRSIPAQPDALSLHKGSVTVRRIWVSSSRQALLSPRVMDIRWAMDNADKLTTEVVAGKKTECVIENEV